MVIQAKKTLEKEEKGTTPSAIRCRILQRYPGVDPIRLNYIVIRAQEEGYLPQPPNSPTKGAMGGFKGRSKEKEPLAVPKVPESKSSRAKEQGGEGSGESEKKQPPRKKTAASAQDLAKAKQATEEKGSKDPKKPRAPKPTQGDPTGAPKGASKSHRGAKAPKKTGEGKAGSTAKGARATA